MTDLSTVNSSSNGRQVSIDFSRVISALSLEVPRNPIRLLARDEPREAVDVRQLLQLPARRENAPRVDPQR